MVVDQEESGPGASVSTKKAAPVSERKSTDWPSTVNNTQGSSSVIRMGACVGTPGHLQSVLIALRIHHLGPTPWKAVSSLVWSFADWT